jgi:hypothetical protein
MAKVKLNPILKTVRGQVGDLVFKRYGDRVILASKPDLTGREPSPAQAAHQERFKQAALYGRMMLADPETKALYETAAKSNGQPVFSLIVADFFNAPSINEVDVSRYSGAAGDVIAVWASDDFAVVEVQVSLSDDEGNLLENGSAVETVAGGWWHYTAATLVPVGTVVRITVTALDRPGSAATETTEVTTA